MSKQKSKELVDRGFDADFSSRRIEEMCALFGSERELQAFVDGIHEDDDTLDMKRGEFYPEILRCIASMKRAAANAYSVDPLQVHPNFGSNGSIDTIMTAMKLREVNRGIDPSREGGMLVATPTYFRNYNSCASKQIRMVKVPLRQEDWSLNAEAMVATMAQQHPTVVFLVTPNNPTGVAIPDADLLHVIDGAPDDTLVVIDRTLVNICDEIATVDLVRRCAQKQVVVLHSSSKYAGLSHLRAGFALYSSVQVAQEIRPHLPLGLGVEGNVKMTRRLVQHGPLRPDRRIVDNIRDSKGILEEFCQTSGRYRCSDFVGNYCLLTTPSNLMARDVTQALEEQGIYVMGGHEFPEPDEGQLRLHTGGKPEYMARTVEALGRLAT